MPENPESEGSRLITLKQIEQDHGVSRSALHTYRRSSTFPQPVTVEGSTKTLYRADEVAAWFDANPKQQGKRRDQFVSHQQGDPMTARQNLYAFAMRGKEQSPALSEEASEKINAYRAAVLLEAANSLAALGPVDSLVSAPDAWTEVIETLRRIADQAPQGEKG